MYQETTDGCPDVSPIPPERPAAGAPLHTPGRRPVSSNALLGGASVRIEAVVLGTGVQPDVEPGNTEPRGADPKGVVAEMLLDGSANCLPQGVALALRRRPQEGSQVGIGRTWLHWEGNDQKGVSTDIGEGDDAGPGVASGELLREWARV